MIYAKRRKNKPVKIKLKKKDQYFSGVPGDNSRQDIFCGECDDKVCLGSFTEYCPDAKIYSETDPHNQHKLYRVIARDK